jgi:drug/metabolite transporter (DMT)-like permease
LIRKSWIVFLFAIILSFESILIEYLTLLLGISPLSISAFSIAISGILLLTILNFVKKRKISLLHSFKDFIPASLFLSVGIFTWYDAVSRVGASKESLLAGPIEIITVLLLARVFLHERLNKKQLSGIAIALVGFVIVILSDHNIDNNDHNIDNNGIINIVLIEFESLNFSISFGDVEAIISAISFALAVFFLAKLSTRYSPLEISGMCLLLSGFILITVMLIFTPEMSINMIKTYWYILIIFSLLPLIGTILYVEGIKRIGASLTSTIASSRILLTLILQILLTQIGIRNTLPDNIFLALIGGILGIT